MRSSHTTPVVDRFHAVGVTEETTGLGGGAEQAGFGRYLGGASLLFLGLLAEHVQQAR